MSKNRVLIVDDDEMILAALGFTFDLLLPGCQVRTARDGATALDELRRQPFDLILTDYSLPGANGLEVARSAQQLSPQACIVLMTGSFGGDDIPAGANSILDGVLRKPFTLHQLNEILQENEIFT